MSSTVSSAMSIDWLAFTIKPDKHSKMCHYISLREVLRLLSIPYDMFVRDFRDIGRRQHYDHTYLYGGIRIYCTEFALADYPELHNTVDEASDFANYINMGINVEMSGQGCREFENLIKLNNSSAISEIVWFSLFRYLSFLVSDGCSLNYTRIDIAYDCYDGTITVDKVRESLKNGEVVTTFRTYQDGETEPVSSVKKSTVKGELLGDSITIGNRKSNTHCCIYDKLAEQKQKYKYDTVALYKLSKLRQWTRFEIRIKNKVANSFVAGLLEVFNNHCKKNTAAVSMYIGSFINTRIRFVHLDDTNKSRCSLKNWWCTFIGSCMRLKMKSIAPVKNFARRAVNYVKHSLAPTLFSLGMKYSPDELWNIISEAAGYGDRLTDKHYRIINAPDMVEDVYANSDYWKGFIFSIEKLRYSRS